MTEITVYTTSEEVNEIYTKAKSWVARSHRLNVKVGDIINFRLCHDQKVIYHQINRKKYEVTRVDDCNTAPIYKYWKLISFREVKDDSAN